MIPARWQRVSELVNAALAHHEGERAAFLRDACGGDNALHQEVVSLLDRHDGADGFLERPAFETAVKALGTDKRVPRPRVPWWIHLSACSFIAYFALVVFSAYLLPLEIGVAVGTVAADGLVVASVTAGSDADRAGVQPNDRIVAINGHHLRGLRDYLGFGASARVGDGQTFLFARGGREFPVTISPHRARASRLRFVPSHIALLVSLVLSLVVIYSRPDDRVARLGALLLASTACAAAPNWPVGLAGTWRQLPIVVGALLWPACLCSIAIGPIMFSLFALFPRRVISRRWIWMAALTPAAVVTAWGGAYMMLVVYRPERAADVPLLGWFMVLGPLSFPAYFASGIAFLVANHRRSVDKNERRRARVLLCGLGAAGCGLLYASVAMILSDRGSRLVPVYPNSVIAGLLFVAMPISFAYAIVAQRLFDIRILVRQGLRYALARRSILSVVPALAVALVVDLVVHAERPLIDILSERGWAYATLAALAAVAYRNRRGWLESLDRRFFRERYNAQQILTQVITEVRAATRLETVAAAAVSRMSAAFHSSFVALLVCEPHQRDFHALAAAPDADMAPHLTRDSTLVGLVRVMGRPVDFCNAPEWLADQLSAEDAAAIRTVGVDLVAPIVTGGRDRREALLVFGTKRSEEPYSRDDRGFVAAVAESLALLVRPPAAAAGTDDAFVECPQCGACDQIHATRCVADGTPLVRVAMPRVLGDRYTILRRLGRGGMGAVYEAHDAALERQVAVKVVRDDMMRRPDAADRFRREALIAASFTHPNVVTVYDFGIAGNTRGYLVMELLIGMTLRERLRRDGRFTPSRMLEVVDGVCHAVDAAHRRQLVHRDLKPDNIFLAQEDVPKVLDFGIAKSVQPETESRSLTVTGAVIGTPGYMSPEQIRGGSPHPSWDIWALAVVVYEMLCGEHPFEEMRSGDSSPTKAPDTWIRVTARRPELASTIDAVFDRAFSPEPAERPSGALVLMHSLEHALDAEAASA